MSAEDGQGPQDRSTEAFTPAVDGTEARATPEVDDHDTKFTVGQVVRSLEATPPQSDRQLPSEAWQAVRTLTEKDPVARAVAMGVLIGRPDLGAEDKGLAFRQLMDALDKLAEH